MVVVCCIGWCALAVVDCKTLLYVCWFLFFFFKQKTAYEMRISDWSSDVCSSDLQARHARIPGAVILAVLRANARRRAIGAAKHDRAAHLAARHIVGLGRRIDDVIDRLHGEVDRKSTRLNSSH